MTGSDPHDTISIIRQGRQTREVTARKPFIEKEKEVIKCQRKHRFPLNLYKNPGGRDEGLGKHSRKKQENAS